MVTSGDEQKGAETGEPPLAANDPAPPTEAAPEQDMAPEEAVAPTGEIGPPASPDDSPPEAELTTETPLFVTPPIAAETLEPLDEDEATGRRVESLLAEAPDGDPEGEQPERGEETPRFLQAAPLEGFALPDEIASEQADAADEAPPTTEGEPQIVSIVDPSFYEPPSAPQPARPLRGRGMDRVGPIVAFDFDGTLTVRDSFTAFLKWREGSGRYHAEMAALAPAALKYLFDRDPAKLKTAAVKRFLAGLPRQVLNEEAMEFAAVSAPMLFRPDALRAWRRYRQDGARLLIVTASPENIVAPFARGLGADMLIATQLLFDQDDRVQGGLLGDNCRGPEKVRRIKEALGEDTVLAAAYGDTDGDWDMLDMAEQQFMRLFVGVPGKTPSPG